MGANDNSFARTKFVQAFAAGNALRRKFINQLGIVNKRS